MDALILFAVLVALRIGWSIYSRPRAPHEAEAPPLRPPPQPQLPPVEQCQTAFESILPLVNDLMRESKELIPFGCLFQDPRTAPNLFPLELEAGRYSAGQIHQWIVEGMQASPAFKEASIALVVQHHTTGVAGLTSPHGLLVQMAHRSGFTSNQRLGGIFHPVHGLQFLSREEFADPVKIF